MKLIKFTVKDEDDCVSIHYNNNVLILKREDAIELLFQLRLVLDNNELLVGSGHLEY